MVVRGCLGALAVFLGGLALGAPPARAQQDYQVLPGTAGLGGGLDEPASPADPYRLGVSETVPMRRLGEERPGVSRDLSAPAMPDTLPDDLATSALRRGPRGEGLGAEERAQLRQKRAGRPLNADVAKAGGFTVPDTQHAMDLSYGSPVVGESEYSLEIQSMLRLPGAAAPVPHKRLLIVKGTRTLKGDTVEFSYKVVKAMRSRLVKKDGKLTEVMTRDPDAEGALSIAQTDKWGYPKDAATASKDRVLEWLRLRLPRSPKEPGDGWKTMVPFEVGSRKEASLGLYMVERRATDQDHGGRDVAVIEGAFQAGGQETGETRFKTKGLDRVLFDVRKQKVLYREFRMEGVYLRNTPQGPKPYQARIKGLLMEKGLLEKHGGPARVSRLNAAHALFGG